jgi:DNA-binding transcriptional LysR family regulator
MSALLFEKSRARGYSLTAEGHRLLAHAEAIERVLDAVRSDVQGEAEVLRGHIRIGTSEGFGCFVLSPQLAGFQRRYPDVRLELLPVPRFVSLSKREADVAVNIEPPTGSAYVRARLAEYALKLYATREYLDQHPPIESMRDLRNHDFIAYVEDLIRSDELRYMEEIAPGDRIVFRSTSIIAQYTAALRGGALAVLPCFLAARDPRLVPVLDGTIRLTRQFWIYCHEEQRRLRRVRALWDFVRDIATTNRAYLLGDSATMVYCD